MANTQIEDIKELLLSIAEDIPHYIRTGVPKNVKSDNVRSLEERNNSAITAILDLVEALYEQSGAMSGTEDPNNAPPSSFSIGQLYMRKDEGSANKELFLYTGIDGLNWWKISKTDSKKTVYGKIANPNTTPPEGSFSVGDYYIRTSTGAADGAVMDIWFFTDLQIGNKWLNINNQSSYLQGTLTLLREAEDAQMRVWSASILGAFVAEKTRKTPFSISSAILLSGEFGLEFIHPEEVDMVVDRLEPSSNWDITWIQEVSSDEKIFRSLRQQYIHAGPREPLTIKHLLEDNLLTINGSITSDITIPANAKFTIW